MKQLIAVAAVRSYSPGLAINSCAQVTKMAGASSRTMRLTANSWAGLTKPHRKEMAIAATC